MKIWYDHSREVGKLDWAERMNRVMDYVEDNLIQTPDPGQISRIAACSYGLFQQTFAQAAGITFGEYLRRRRLTMAAWEIQNTNQRILDIALKYGYDSPDAFRVAFRRLHGVSPSAARQTGVQLAFYCKLRFELQIRGVDRMRYTLEKREGFRVIGVRRTTPYGGGTWAIVKTDGSSERMHALTGSFFDLGLCFGFGEDGSDDYMCAVEWEGDAGGFDVYEYPASDWLRFEAKGKISEGVLGDVWRRINEEFFPQSRYLKCGRRKLPTIEKYVHWDERTDFCHVEILIPVDER